jgi:outer membrane protein assembly factor BamB
MKVLKTAAILSIGLAATIHGENWPNWRGPSMTGVSPEKGLPARWSDTENVAWKASIRGLGISSPIVWGDRVFVTSQVGGGVSRTGPRLVQGEDAAAAGERALGGGATGASTGTDKATFLITAFDRVSGRRLWEHELLAEGPLPPVHEKHNLATPSPVTDGQRLYAWFGTGQVVALDMSGKLVWQRNLTEYGRFDINWGSGSSPILHGDMLVLLCYHNAPNSYLLALDTATGANKWKADRSGGVFSYSTPFVAQVDGGAELIVNSSEGISGHSLTSGEQLWLIPETNRFPIPVASQHEGIVYTSRGYRSGPFMAFRPGGKGDVSKSHVLWKVETGAPYISSLVHHEGLLYMVGDVGVASVIDAKDGQRLWQERIGGVYSASPVVADGKIYFFGESGETVVLSAGRTPAVLARNKIAGRQLGSPAVSNGRLFIRTDDALYAIGTPGAPK